MAVYGARPAPASPTPAAAARELGAPGGGSYFRSVMLLWEGSRDRCGFRRSWTLCPATWRVSPVL